MICENLTVSHNGHLCFGGQDVTVLSNRYGTPLCLMDEDRIRANCRLFREAMLESFGEDCLPLYASKACSFKQIYRIMSEEGMGIDLVSAGEIATAKAAGFDLSKGYFHGNNKTDDDIRYAMEAGVGCFVVDNPEEAMAIQRIAESFGRKQKVLLRLTPGIDPHTYEQVNTGMVDSKFGQAIATGQAEQTTALMLSMPNLDFAGYHCHIGSQVFTEDVFEQAAQVSVKFARDMRDKLGFTPCELNLGGGFGVRYVESDPVPDVRAKIASISKALHEACRKYSLPVPRVLLEPGRAIVADAGLTVYTVGTVKTIPGYRTYVSVDGGMTDNPRFALYRARYTVFAANRMNESTDLFCSVVGRCCESGDILQEQVPLPSSLRRGDLLAVCTGGAYQYSMSSNYNRIPRPPVIMLRDGESYTAVRRETAEDLLRLDE